MFVPCPRCQQQNYPNATQCAYCGTPLSPSMVGSAPAQGPGVQGFGGTGAPGFSSGATGPGPAGEPSMSSASQPQVGQLIDKKYRVERILGEGGMGVVYVALDINADQRVVIKSIRPEFANRGDFRERTLSEGKALAKIDHQNVVRFNSIINSVETNELYIVMQFIDGESLDRTLEKANAAGQKLPITEVIRVFKQILDGVGAAHKEGLMHRDLKPANVLVRAKDGVAKVMDFGISKAEGATKGPTQAGGIVGSLWYMAPEQIKGARDLDKRLDVYALGIVLYELVTGVVPFDGETEYDIMSKHMTDPVPSVRGLRPDAPDWVDTVIQRATQKDRAQRFQSCEEMRAMVDQFDGGITVPRSSTAFENSIIPENSQSGYGPSPAAGTPVGGGTSVMSGGAYGAPTTNAGYAAPAIPASPSRASLPSAKKGGSTGLIIGIVAVLAIGGGAAFFFTRGGGDDPGKDKTSLKDKDPKEKDPKEKDPKEKDPKQKDTATADTGKKPPPEKPNPLKALAGMWKSDSGRLLKAEVDSKGEEVDFNVVRVEDFKGAYHKGETRFSVTKGDDDTSFYVTDKYRPTPPAGAKYSADGFASCLTTYTGDDKGQTLVAKLKGDKIEVSLVVSTVGVNPPVGGEIPSCTTGKFASVTLSTFKRTDDDE